MIIFILIISYIPIFYSNFELIFEFMALRRAPVCGRNACLSFFCVFLYLIVIILIEENKKKLTLCQNNEKWTKNLLQPTLAMSAENQYSFTAPRMCRLRARLRIRHLAIFNDSLWFFWILLWTRLSNFQNQSLRFYWIKLIPHMILKNLSTNHWFWIDYNYGKSLILPLNGPSFSLLLSPSVRKFNCGIAWDTDLLSFLEVVS